MTPGWKEVGSNWAEVREYLAHCSGGCCTYCGSTVHNHKHGDWATKAAVEHIMPRSRGGSDELDNLTLACNLCNSRKGTLTGAEFLARIQGTL